MNTSTAAEETDAMSLPAGWSTTAPTAPADDSTTTASPT